MRPNWLVCRILERELTRRADSFVSGRLVDIGCGEKPYEGLLAPYVAAHIGVDHDGTSHDKSKIDRVGTAYEIPADDGEFDSAICTAVLEHLEEPESALRECYRVLRPGGVAIYSVPFIWHLHEEPRDFFRFSKYGLKYLFGKVGFEIVEIAALSGFWVTFGQLSVYSLYRFDRGPLRWFRVVAAIGFIVQGLSYLLDKIDKSENWTWMYLVVARRPQE